MRRSAPRYYQRPSGLWVPPEKRFFLGAARAGVFGAAGAGVTPPTLVSSATPYTNSTSTSSSYGPTINVPSSIELWLMLICIINGADASLASVSASSSVNGALSTVVASPGSGANPHRGTVCALYYQNPTSGDHTVTITPSSGDTDAIVVFSEFWTGVDPVSPFGADTYAVRSTSAGDTLSGDIDTDKKNSVVVAFGGAGINGSTTAFPFSWANSLSQVTTGTSGSGTTDLEVAVATKTASTVGNYLGGATMDTAGRAYAFGMLSVRGV